MSLRLECRAPCESTGDERGVSDEPAAESARALNARAYTVGMDVVFDSGEYAPESAAGRWLLRHELGHVIEQQTTGERVQLASKDPSSATDFIDAADDSAEATFSGDVGEPKSVGSAGEREHVREVRSSLEAEGYQVYIKDQFDDVP